ncbi:hypothetical protein [Kocuria sp.]|uniref:hypothetical protein n=1 Tax=Kocuria sp. TaxID=1871328 RepID=UPI0026DF8692|nr:hypothetical protein [Kocuria sp.]MDO5617653.1 hypothetical protein [Kocuria sp.]
MSALGRLALLAAGAAAGAVATRWAGSAAGRKVLSELAPGSREPAPELTAAGESSAAPHGAQQTGRENKLASRLLRIAQDVRAGSAQREDELRRQLGLPAPDQIRPRQALQRGHQDRDGGRSQLP